MVKKKLPKSIRKFIRKKKAQIRRQILDFKEQEKQIQEFYQKISEKRNPRFTAQGIQKRPAE